MKKIIFALAVLTMAVACNKDQVVDQQTPNAISFGNVFVDKATRAAIDRSYNSLNLDKFYVYGIITNNKTGKYANIFCNVDVTRSVDDDETVWSYDPKFTQYWIPGNTYNFTAIVDGNVNRGTQDEPEYATGVRIDEENETRNDEMPTHIDLYDASEQPDILYAESGDIACTSIDEDKIVAFTFNHLMSKAKFTVSNVMANPSGYAYKVRDICITNAAKTATYTIGAGWGKPSWKDAKEETYQLMFGNAVKNSDEKEADYIYSYTNGTYDSVESRFEHLLIPTYKSDEKTTIEVEFICELYKDNVLIQDIIKHASTSALLEAGHAYNFSIALGEPGKPIKFTVIDVNGWDRDLDGDNEVDTNHDVATQPK